MPSGADLEYARLLAEANVNQANAQGLDAARLEQINDEKAVDLQNLVQNGRLSESNLLALTDQRGRSAASAVVAAVDSDSTAAANFRCDGINDQDTINAAIASLGVSGGSVKLLAGTYNISDSIVIDRKSIRLYGEHFSFWDKYIGRNWATYTGGDPGQVGSEGFHGVKIKATAGTFPLIFVDDSGLTGGVSDRINGLEIDHLYLYGASKTATTSVGISNDGGKQIEGPYFHHLFIHNTFRGIRVASDGAVFTDNSIQGIGEDAIQIIHAAGGQPSVYPWFGFNVIADNGGYAVWTQAGTQGPQVFGLLAVRTAGLYINAYDAVLGGNMRVTEPHGHYNPANWWGGICATQDPQFQGGIQVDASCLFEGNSVFEKMFSADIRGKYRGKSSTTGIILDIKSAPRSRVDVIIESVSTTASGIRIGDDGGHNKGLSVDANVNLIAASSSGIGYKVEASLNNKPGQYRGFVNGNWSTPKSIPSAVRGLITVDVISEAAIGLPITDDGNGDTSLLTPGLTTSGHLGTPNSGTWGRDADGEIYLVSGTSQNFYTWDTGHASHKGTIKIGGSSSSAQGIALSFTNIAQTYVVTVNDSGSIKVFRFNGGVTELASAVTAVSTGDEVTAEFDATANTITVKKNGTNVTGLVGIGATGIPEQTFAGLWTFGEASASVRSFATVDFRQI